MNQTRLILLPNDEAYVLGEHVRTVWLGGEKLEPGMVMLRPDTTAEVVLITAINEVHNEGQLTKYHVEFEDDSGKFSSTLPEDQEVQIVQEKVTA